MTPDEKAELRKAAEKPPDGPIYRTIGDDIAIVVRCKHVLALLDENARLAAEVERLPKWIPCSERMPPTGLTIFVEGGCAFFDGIDWRTMTGFASGKKIQWDVIWWMPLPEPPK